MRAVVWITLVLVVVEGTARAEMEKIAITCGEQTCFYWWPILPVIPGWHQDRDYSFHYSANAQAPDGTTFSDADAVIYAKALYKPRVPETTSLAQLIEDDKAAFLSQNASISVREQTPITNADGQVLRSLTFTPRNEGNWERVSYGIEGNFYLIFTLSARSQKAFEKALDDYKRFVGEYRAKP